MKLIKPAIILVRPQLPENIGLVARAMHNFGLSELILVSPREKWPNKKSLQSAKNASIVIKKTKVYKSIELAISKFHYVLATTNRKRFLEKKTTNSFNDLNKYIFANKKIAILFGPENSGLSNSDLRLVDCIFTIPTSKINTSLNLSHAVSIVVYKIFEFIKINKINLNNTVSVTKISDKKELTNFMKYLILQLEKENFFYPLAKKQSMIDNIYAIFLKASLSKKEVNTLWGMFKKLTK